MKKFIALALAILMMAAIAVPTFAAEIANGGELKEIEGIIEKITYKNAQNGYLSVLKGS